MREPLRTRERAKGADDERDETKQSRWSVSAINFGGRFAYLECLQEQRPEILRDLGQHVLPLYQQCRQQGHNLVYYASLTQLSPCTDIDAESKSHLKTLQTACERWADRYGIQDAWIFEAAFQTMEVWICTGVYPKWTYVAKDFEKGLFKPTFGLWIPSIVSWKDFKRTTDQLYRQQLKAYHAETRRHWGENMPNLRQHAEWTLLWQRGKSPGAIKHSHLKKTGRKVSLANIQTRVIKFAKSISLTLRASKAGPRARKL